MNIDLIMFKRSRKGKVGKCSCKDKERGGVIKRKGIRVEMWKYGEQIYIAKNSEL